MKIAFLLKLCENILDSFHSEFYKLYVPICSMGYDILPFAVHMNI